MSAFFKRHKRLRASPLFTSQPNQLTITVPYYILNNGGISDSSLKALRSSLALEYGHLISKNRSNSFDENQNAFTKVLHLRLIQLKYPYLNAEILRQYLAMNTSKYNFSRVRKRIFKNSRFDNSRSDLNLKEIKLELAGRLTTQRSVPRKTVETAKIRYFNFGDNLAPKISKIMITSFADLLETNKAKMRKHAKVKIRINTVATLKTATSSKNQFRSYTGKNKLNTFTIKSWLR